MHHLSKWEIRFRMASSSFFTLVDAVETCEGILALLDTFQESISNLMKLRVVYAAI